MALFEKVEERLVAQGLTPLSLSPQRQLIERTMVAAWSAGSSPTIEELLKEKDEPATANVAAA